MYWDEYVRYITLCRKNTTIRRSLCFTHCQILKFAPLIKKMKKTALLLSFITLGLFTACETLDTANDGNKQ